MSTAFSVDFLEPTSDFNLISGQKHKVWVFISYQWTQTQSVGIHFLN